MSFIAQYHGECDSCGGDLKGYEVDFEGSRLVHVKCPETEVEAPAGVPLCNVCWLHHRGDCL